MIKPKNIVVTGGNNGIGFQTVKALYEEGNNVIFGARSVEKNKEVIEQITQKSGGTIISFPLDLSKRNSIEEFVKNVKAKFNYIDILVNNAGLSINELQRNQSGIEMTLAINHFGHFYLTYLLWDWLIKSAETRIINVSSGLHFQAPNNYLDDIQCRNKSYGPVEQYNISKLFNVLFTQGINNLINNHNLKSVKTASLHPGVVDTNFGQGNAFFQIMKCLCCCLVFKQQRGARTSLYLCRTPLAEIRSGQYYDQDTHFKEMDPRGRNAADVQRLWKMSQKNYGITFR